VGESAESLAKARVSTTHCSPLIHMLSQFIAEDSRMDQARFTLGWSNSPCCPSCASKCIRWERTPGFSQSQKWDWL